MLSSIRMHSRLQVHAYDYYTACILDKLLFLLFSQIFLIARFRLLLRLTCFQYTGIIKIFVEFIVDI